MPPVKPRPVMAQPLSSAIAVAIHVVPQNAVVAICSNVVMPVASPHRLPLVVQTRVALPSAAADCCSVETEVVVVKLLAIPARRQTIAARQPAKNVACSNGVVPAATDAGYPVNTGSEFPKTPGPSRRGVFFVILVMKFCLGKPAAFPARVRYNRVSKVPLTIEIWAHTLER